MSPSYWNCSHLVVSSKSTNYYLPKLSLKTGSSSEHCCFAEAGVQSSLLAATCWPQLGHLARLGEQQPAVSCLSKYGYGCRVQTASPQPPAATTRTRKHCKTSGAAVPRGFSEVRFLKINADVKIVESVQQIKKDDARDVRETQVQALDTFFAQFSSFELWASHYLRQLVSRHFRRHVAALFRFVGVDTQRKRRMFGFEKREVDQTKAMSWQFWHWLSPHSPPLVFWQWKYTDQRHSCLCCQ